MPNGEAWLLRPVLAGCVKYESLIDGTLDLADVATMNDALDVRQENQTRIDEWQQKMIDARSRSRAGGR